MKQSDLFRKDHEIILDFVQRKTYGDVILHEELEYVLKRNSEHSVKKKRIYNAIPKANKRLLETQKKYLEAIKNVGYKVINPEEHVNVSLKKKQAAQNYFEKGLEILRNTHVDALTDSQLKMHQGQLLLMSGLYEKIKYAEERQEKAESAIDNVRKQQETARKQQEEADRKQDEILRRLQQLETQLSQQNH